MNTSKQTNEPQTAKYQAAVDNIMVENRRNARHLQNNWNFQHEIMWDRWDYVTALEEAIAAEVLHASHPYRLYSNRISPADMVKLS